MDGEAANGDGGIALGTMGRRRAITILGAGLVALAGCGSSDDGGTAATTGSTGGLSSSTTAGAAGTTASTTDDTTVTGTCDTIPEETAGPFPGDGSNGPDVLAEDGVVRQDIRTSLGGGSTAEGVPLTINLTLVDTANGCAPLASGAVYLWHCDRDGAYSMYSDGAAAENYLRGVQAAGADGKLSFTSIYPGAYSGRWPHIHFEVFPTVDDATAGSNQLATSQLALPEDTCTEVYATEGYEQSVTNMASMSIETDGIFSDGYDLQLAAMSGNAQDGYVAELTVAV